MLPLEQSDTTPQPDQEPTESSPGLRLVAEPVESSDDLPFESGLARAVVLGGIVGFLFFYRGEESYGRA